MTGSGGNLSSRVLQLRFMQRAMDKAKVAQNAQDVKETEQEERWEVHGAKDRCIVVLEGDPSISAGRISFRGTCDADAMGASPPVGKFEEPSAAVQGDSGLAEMDMEMANRLAKGSQKRLRTAAGKKFKKPPDADIDSSSFQGKNKRPKR